MLRRLERCFLELSRLLVFHKTGLSKQMDMIIIPRDDGKGVGLSSEHDRMSMGP